MVRVAHTQHRPAPRTAVQRHQNHGRHGKPPINWKRPAPAHLVARLAVAKSKHQSYFEIADNTDKKKKLEVINTSQRRPFPGFTFVPYGNPKLTDACKELSRERGAVVYIVSEAPENKIRLHSNVYRIGCHFRSGIVEHCATELDIPQFRDSRAGAEFEVLPVSNVNKIPDTQAEINAQADAAIRDLFPRIPNTDRQMVIDHAFKKGTMFGHRLTVGNAKDVTLVRRVQLAVIAHIRHVHTRYDMLLRECQWEDARKTVESLILDILVKWRGDEETGRDQLDEVLREVVVISDSEESDDDQLDSDADNADDDDDDDEADDDENGLGKDDNVASNVEQVVEPDSNDAMPLEDDEVTSSLNNILLPHASKDQSASRKPATSSAVVESTALSSRHLSTRTVRRKQRGDKLRERAAKGASRMMSTKAKVARAERDARRGQKRYEAYQKALDRRRHVTDLDRPPNTDAGNDSRDHHALTEERSSGSHGFQRTLRVYNDDPLDDSVPVGLLSRPTNSKQIPNHATNSHFPRSAGPAKPKRTGYNQKRGNDSDHDARNHNQMHRNFTPERQFLDVTAGYRDMPVPSIERSLERVSSRQEHAPIGHDDIRTAHIMPNQQYRDVIYLDGSGATPVARHPYREDYVAYSPREHVMERESIQEPRRRRVVRVITVPDYAEDGFEPVRNSHTQSVAHDLYRNMRHDSNMDGHDRFNASQTNHHAGIANQQYFQPSGSTQLIDYREPLMSGAVPIRPQSSHDYYDSPLHNDRVEHSDLSSVGRYDQRYLQADTARQQYVPVQSVPFHDGRHGPCTPAQPVEYRQAYRQGEPIGLAQQFRQHLTHRTDEDYLPQRDIVVLSDSDSA